MIMKSSLKESELKKVFKEKGLRISKANLEKFSKIAESFIGGLIEKVERNAKISGRKTIKN